MKGIFNSIFVFLLTFAASAQTPEADSLWRQLPLQQEDSNRVFTLNRLSKIYRSTKPDSSMLLSKQALEVARSMGFARGEAECLNGIGNVFLMNGNYPEALENYLEMLKIYEKLNDAKGMGVGTANVALIYFEQGDFRSALSYYFKSKEIFDTATTDIRLVINLLNIGDTYEKMNKLDSALQFTQQGYELALRQGDKEYVGMAVNNLGNIHVKMGNTNLAKEFYRLSVAYSVPINDNYVLGETYLGMARLFQKGGQNDSALYYAKLALAMGQSFSGYKFIKNAAEFLVDYYESSHAADSAYHYSKIAVAARDSVFSEEKVKQVQSLKFSEQLRQQEIAMEKAQAQKARKANLQFLLIGIFFVALSLYIVLMIRKKTKSRFVEWMALVGLLLLFEFIIILVHPYIGEISHDSPVVMLIMQGCIAAVLAPVHHFMVKLVRRKLHHKIVLPPEPVPVAAARPHA